MFYFFNVFLLLNVGLLDTIAKAFIVSASNQLNSLGEFHYSSPLVSEHESRGFFITITSDRMMHVGLQEDPLPFMSVSLNDDDLFYNTRYVGINTSGTNGTWNLCDYDGK